MDRVRIAKRIGLVALAALLTACAEPGAGTDTGAPATPATTTETTTTEPNTGGDTRVGLSRCQQADGGRVHFRLNQTVFAVVPDQIQETIPLGLAPPYTPETVKAALETQTANGGGCPERPLDLLVLAVKTDLGDPLLAGTVGFLAANPGRLSNGYADVTARLQANPPADCQRLGGDLLGCAGTETTGNRRAEVMYLISTNRSLRMNSGGPLAARCSITEGQVTGCNIIDNGPSGVIFDAILTEGDYSTAAFQSAWAAINRSIQTFTR